MRDIASEYRITSTGAGWSRATNRGWLRFDGRDAVTFLHALLTNDVAALSPMAGGYGLYLTPQGRLIADLELLHRGDHLVAGVPAGASESLSAAFDRVIFAEEVQVRDESNALATIAIVGKRAAEIAAQALGLDSAAIEALPVWSQLNSRDSFIVRTDASTEDIFNIVTPTALSADVIEQLQRAGAQPVSDELLEALRIEAARPRFGVDMTAETIPLEAGLLDRAISQTKGCYVGQEVIIRVLHRGGGRVLKRLVQITATGGEATLPPAGANVLVNWQDVGAVTSAAVSPQSGKTIALAYLRREHAEVGTEIVVQWQDSPHDARRNLAASVTRLAG